MYVICVFFYIFDGRNKYFYLFILAYTEPISLKKILQLLDK